MQLDGKWSKTLGTGRGGYLKGPVDDVTPCHCGTCDIYRMFGDAVCVMILACLQIKLLVPRALAMSRLSVTKAGLRVQKGQLAGEAAIP